MNEAQKKIIALAKKILNEIKSGKNPSIEIPKRTLANIIFDEKTGRILLGEEVVRRYFLNIAHAKKFMQTLLIASHAKRLLDENATNSLREVFYVFKRPIHGMKENIFDNQKESDPVIVDLEVSLGVTREELNITADRKGYAAGNMTVVDMGDEIDLRKMGSGGWGIPSNVEPHRVQFKEVDADFVLVVEKDAVWQRLNEDKFWKKYNCILVTPKGQAARGTRRLIHRLRYEHNLPVYVFTDYDPWGFYIYSVIKRGSMNLAHLSEKLATPDAKFIGLVYEDIKKFEIPKHVFMKQKDVDKKRAHELMNYEWFKTKEWQKELKQFIKSGIKLEMEALAQKDIRFYSQKYLPTKLKEKSFLP